MDIKINCKLGGRFLSDNQIKIEFLKKALSDYEKIKQQRLLELGDKIDKNNTFFLKGFGNDIDLIRCLREFMFNVREILDSLLAILHDSTANERVAVSRHFMPFLKQLAKGNYDNIDLDILRFAKTNISYIFQIRKIRNEIKNNISNIKFRLVNKDLQAYFMLPLEDSEIELLPLLDIRNKEEAIKNKSYHAIIILDKYLPELIEFCNVILEKIQKLNKRE